MDALAIESREISGSRGAAVHRKTVRGNVVAADNPVDRHASITGGYEAQLRCVRTGLGLAGLSWAEIGEPLRRSGWNSHARNVGSGRKTGRGGADQCGRRRGV